MIGANPFACAAGTDIPVDFSPGIPPGGDVRLSLCTKRLEMEQ